ncbi:glycosyltransferase family 39 protein [Acidobacteria bacterium AH-259-D05]|nr:glycosyltransferase family 39 protein [Acidobacteria bacterium AH-259-D05]
MRDSVPMVDVTSGPALHRPFFLLFGLLWIFTYVLFPSWMLPGPRWTSLIALVCLLIFVSSNLWLFHRWHLDEHLYWRWTFDPKRIVSIVTDHPVLVIGLFMVAVLHIYPLVVAPLGAGDAPGIALTGPNLLSPLWSIAAHLAMPVVWIRLLVVALGAVAVGVASRVFSISSLRSLLSHIRRPQVLLPLGLVGLLLLLGYAWVLSSLFVESAQVDPPITFHREPPIGRLILVGFTLLFGANEIAVRLPQLLFLLGAIVYLYRLVALHRDAQVALLSAFTFGLIPPVFHYTHQAYLEGGLLFFVVAASFYFLRHLRDGIRNDLFMGVLLASAGFLYKRPAVLVLAVFAVYVILLSLYHRRWVIRLPLSDYARSFWVCLAGVGPWLILVGWFTGPGRFLRYRYDLSLNNWLSLDLATGYLQQLPLQLSWPIVFLILLSLIYAFIVCRDAFFSYTLTWFGVFYVFFTSDSCTQCVGHDRFALVWFPCMAIWIGQFAMALARLSDFRWLQLGFSAALLGYLGLVSTVVRVPPLSPQYASYLNAAGDVPPSAEVSAYWKEKVNPNNAGTSYLPYDQVYAYFRREPHLIDKMLIWDKLFLQFYSYKYELRLDLYECSDHGDKCRFGTMQELLKFSRVNRIRYLLVPIGYNYLGNRLSVQFLSPPLGQSFHKGDFEPFELVRRFEHGANALVLLQASGGRSGR